MKVVNITQNRQEKERGRRPGAIINGNQRTRRALAYVKRTSRPVDLLI